MRSALGLVVVMACAVAPRPPSPMVTTTPAAPPSTAVATSFARSTTTLASTTTAPTATTLALLQGLSLETVTEGLTQPLLLLSPPGDERRLVVQRNGVISILTAQGQVLGEPFLDLRDRVNSGGIEQGLLGMAFHPGFTDNGRLFVYYYRLGSEETRLSEFVSEDPNRVDPDSERALLTFEKPTTRHNGGTLLFGDDGYLWMSLGEGGAASLNSQDSFRLLSSILRLDVDNGDPYGIPGDNPFADGVGGAPEVWAKGLRNPWRFTIDEDLAYIADVGHEELEEINVVPTNGAPYNFGWLRMEGTQCFQRGCDPVAENLTLPLLEYTHEEGCSITGGYVYRGAAIPEIDGHYFYADWCGQWVRSFRHMNGELTDHQTWFEDAGQINSFGVDSQGELYLLTYEGAVKKIVPVR